MKKPSDLASIDLEELRAKIIGLGERSARKSYYPELRAHIAELERFRAALDESCDAILLAELPGGQLHDVNKTACRMLGVSGAELRGRSLGEIVPALRGSLERAGDLATGNRETVETTVRTREGGEIPVRVTMTVVCIAGARYAAAVMHDITERRRADAERELLLARERAARMDAERANRLKDEFVATVSHELRTPLNAIQGWTQLMRRPSATAEQLAKGLDVIARNTGWLAQIVADLLDVSRIAAGKFCLDVAPVDLAAVVEAGLEGLRAAAEAKGVALHGSLASAGALVSGDARRLQQVVSNLLSNAIKFTPKGGRIDVTLAPEADRVVLEVRDTGQGIEPEFLPHIFDRFRQADASAARRHGGLGLGLAIVKHVVEQHGGAVCAQSAGRGAGACFRVELPVGGAGGGARAPGSDEHWAPPDLSGTRVLVVEDEPDARELVRRVLEEQGAEVWVVASASEALEALAQHRPDVLVSDIGMPGMDGYELMRQIRAGHAPRMASTPAIALTAFARAEDREDALRAGYQEHLPKPVDPAVLVAMVARIAGQGPRPGARRPALALDRR